MKQSVFGRKYAKRFNLTTAYNYWKDSYRVTRYPEVVSVELDDSILFIFRSGVAVVWGEEVLLKSLESAIDIFSENPTPTVYSDTYVYTTKPDQPFGIENDEFRIPDDSIDVKMSISHALARSIQLDSNENAIEAAMNVVGDLPSRLAKTGKIPLPAKNIKKLVGSILEAQFSINQFGLVADRPDVFWERPELEQFYKKTGTYLELQDRWNVLSDKIVALQEALDVLRDEVNTKNSHLLEWIIIILILIELVAVAVEYIMPFIYKYI